MLKATTPDVAFLIKKLYFEFATTLKHDSEVDPTLMLGVGIDIGGIDIRGIRIGFVQVRSHERHLAWTG